MRTETHEAVNDLKVTAPCTTELQKIELDTQSTRPNIQYRSLRPVLKKNSKYANGA